MRKVVSAVKYYAAECFILSMNQKTCEWQSSSLQTSR
jgi:hypothetical protein